LELAQQQIEGNYKSYVKKQTSKMEDRINSETFKNLTKIDHKFAETLQEER